MKNNKHAGGFLVWQRDVPRIGLGTYSCTKRRSFSCTNYYCLQWQHISIIRPRAWTCFVLRICWGVVCVTAQAYEVVNPIIRKPQMLIM